jgi:cytochrome P450
MANPEEIVVTSKRARFNPFTAEFRRDPYPLYHRLRAQDPVHRNLGMWVLTRYCDVMTVLTDRTFSVSQIPDEAVRHGAKLGDLTLGAIERLGRKSIVFTDEPDHARLRTLINRSFSPKAIQALRPAIERRVQSVLGRLETGDIVDFIAEFADPVPLHVMADMMALPAEVRPLVKDWTHRIRFLLEPGLMSKEVFEDVRGVLDDYMACIRDIVRARKHAAGDDLLSVLSASHVGQDALSEEEVVFSAIMTFVAGHETTKFALGNGMFALLAHPDQMSQLRQNPPLMEGAVHEVMRYLSPLQQTKRRATRELEIGGRTIKPDEQLLLCLGAANRDPEVFDQPDRFDVTRASRKHIALGFGMHQCVGGALARLETEIALEALLRRFSAFELAADTVDWVDHSFILRGPKSLPIRARR